MKFVFVVKTKDGTTRRGQIEAQSRTLALRELKQRKFVVVSLVEARERSRGIYLTPITVVERVVLTKHLAIMLRAGISIDEALRIAELQAKGKMQKVLSSIRKAVEGGQRLSDAMEQFREVFSNYYINMVRAGEESGNLAENLEQLSGRFAKDYELRRKAQSAMLYPLLVIVLTGTLGAIISLYVLPRLTGLFDAFDFELPLTTRILLWMSSAAQSNGVLIAIIILTLMVGSLVVLKARFAQPVMHWLVLKLPIAKRIAIPLNLSRFGTVLGSLMKSGVPIDVSLTVTEQVIGNIYYRRIIGQAAERVKQGEPFSSALTGSEDIFPPFVYRMIQIGDETGQTEDVLFYLADFYEDELDVNLKNLSTIIEPLLLVTIGIIVALVALSIITPIYGFISVIG